MSLVCWHVGYGPVSPQMRSLVFIQCASIELDRKV